MPDYTNPTDILTHLVLGLWQVNLPANDAPTARQQVFYALIHEKDRYFIDSFSEDDRAVHFIPMLNEDAIKRFLCSKYPAPRGLAYFCSEMLTCNYWCEATELERRNSSVYGVNVNAHGRKKDNIRLPGWITLTHPLVTLESPDLVDLIGLSQQYGSLLLDKATILPSKSRAASEGFSWVETRTIDRDIGSQLWRIRYSPNSLRSRERQQTKREVQKRLVKDFPQPEISDLYRALSFDNWKNPKHRLADHVRSVELQGKSGGWGHRGYVIEFSISEIISLLDAGRWACGARWYHELSPSKLGNCIQALLPYLHNIEKTARQAREAERQRFNQVYNTHTQEVTDFNTGRELYLSQCCWEDNGGYCPPPQLVTRYPRRDTSKQTERDTESDTVKQAQQLWNDPPESWPYPDAAAYVTEQLKTSTESWCDKLKLCRFLRKEARRLKITLPPPPKLPPAPAKRKRKS